MSESKAPAACRAESRFLPILLLSLGPSALAQDFSALDAAAGQALFERNWVQAPASAAAADGLGPYYNARSCAACHPGGGGSSATEAMNVVLAHPVYGEILQLHATAGLSAEGSFEIGFRCVEDALLSDGTSVELHCPVASVRDGATGRPANIPGLLRRAPALFGMAALEKVEAAELQRLADPNDSNGDGISGRVSLIETPQGTLVGRYGWKAAIPTLRLQIARALSLDLGLSTSVQPNPAGDCTPNQTACLQAAGPADAEPEVSDLMLDLLETYLASLPSPAAESTPDAEGAQVFAAIGCTDCHVPELQAGSQVVRPYSDLLLHNMGLLLGDDLTGNEAASAEWRTAPLWGLGQATSFMHDARAATLEEAILWHGGEAESARNAYYELNEDQRRVLLIWLRGL
jgi:CxxC motif-containing protein (DUF1111 family)